MTYLDHFFCADSNFEIRVIIRDSEFAQILLFLENWLLHKSWQKVKIFIKDLSCSVFRIHFDCGFYLFFWESRIAQILWFYNCWLWCKLWPRIKIFEKYFSHLVFCEDFDFGVRSCIWDLFMCKWLNSKMGDFCVELNKSQSFQAKLVLLGFTRLEDLPSDPFLQSTGRVQNLSS